ncbi:hypothetical protein QGN29_10910 [Temperatibacter marinus]|uniref:Uncharacterized protein n=1 Tax=Temperatibacter marinus TaxID=1456591 RepID=A0AA52EB27_9PROT|nr:hypothetical protein [Temperatibacter marinus]WND02057.1 hypothetical protein QGN29_10910 [Temperatibacter marinus]
MFRISITIILLTLFSQFSKASDTLQDWDTYTMGMKGCVDDPWTTMKLCLKTYLFYSLELREYKAYLEVVQMKNGEKILFIHAVNYPEKMPETIEILLPGSPDITARCGVINIPQLCLIAKGNAIQGILRKLFESSALTLTLNSSDDKHYSLSVMPWNNIPILYKKGLFKN